MDAITLLKEDHKLVKKLLTELTDSTARAVKTRTDLLQQIHVNLKAHTTIEEEIFYPAFKAAGKKKRRRCTSKRWRSTARRKTSFCPI